MRKTERVSKTQKTGYGDENVETYSHPAFAMMRVSEPQGHKVLFGSEIEHSEYVQISIVPATMDRGLSSNWFHGETRPIVQFSMSHAQFVSMLSSGGKYTGIPVTLDVAPKDRNKSIESIPNIEYMEKQIDMADYEVDKNTQHSLDLISKKVAELSDAIENKKGIKAQRDIMHSLNCMIKNLPHNVKDIVTQAKSNIEQVKHTAQIEIEAIVSRHIHDAGLDSLGIKKPQHMGIDFNEKGDNQ